MLRAGCLGDHEQRRLTQQEPEGDLARGRPVRGGDLPQDATAFGVRAREVPMAERAVSDYRDAVSLAPGDHRMLDGSLLEVVEDLVAREEALPCNLAGLLQVGYVEIAHAPGKNLPNLPERLEGREGLLQRV